MSQLNAECKLFSRSWHSSWQLGSMSDVTGISDHLSFQLRQIVGL